jgi:hypothetical protein
MFAILFGHFDSMARNMVELKSYLTIRPSYIVIQPLRCRLSTTVYRAGIFKQSMGARNRGGMGLSYRPARLHRLAELFLGIDSWAPKIRAQYSMKILYLDLRDCNYNMIIIKKIRQGSLQETLLHQCI